MDCARSSVRGVCQFSAGLLLLAAVHGSIRAGEVVSLDTPKRSWGTEQALGEPDTMMAGDIETAWASQSADEEREWLIVGYEQAVMPKALAIHETYNPGAVDKVTVFGPDGNEVLAWEGDDPTPQGSGKGISVIPLKVDFEVQRLKIYVNSPAVSGWNEIDAVALTSSTGEVQWAVEAEASSTYASQPVPQETPFITVDSRRLEQLEAEVATLRQEVERLKDIEAELREIKEMLRDR
jgi:hypothetical protein